MVNIYTVSIETEVEEDGMWIAEVGSTTVNYRVAAYGKTEKEAIYNALVRMAEAMKSDLVAGY
ncbi:MAG: type II toxin-antitoxin system HicB family antitoxin [Candidatus Competibacteraceae bacterium]|nr:type II toxin-antitoxin system HicB family antitoxin [Candidatus Competibacteraceae bacterium]